MQFCPIDSSHFVVGTYNLENKDPVEEHQVVASVTEGDPEDVKSTAKTPQNRNGSLILFHLDGDDLYVPFHANPELICS